MIAKIVTKSRPLLIADGNTWVSDAVYKNGEDYYKQEIQAPSLKHGPFVLGEEVEIEPSPNDLKAEEYLIEIYQNPLNYNDIMLNYKYDIDSNKYVKIEITETKKNNSRFLDTIIAILIVFIIGVILYTLILG